MQLIITEKAIAGQRIASLLSGKEVVLRREDDAQVGDFRKGGKEFVVIPLRGHIANVDFPKRFSYWLGTDLKQLTMAPVEYVGTEKAIIQMLKKRAKDADSVIIATDADREGESIGVEALDYLKEGNPSLSVQRAYFSAITPKDIETAFSQLGKVDFNFADSANARREVDLIWGAVLTRFVSLMSGRMGKEFLSVGRVQTPSVDYNEDIVIKQPDGTVSLEKIGQFVEANSLELEREIGSCKVFKAKSGFEALSFNPQTLKTEFKPITHTVKHRFLGNLLQIVLETGRKVKITGSHSVFVVRDSTIQVLLGDELKEGDVLLAPKKVTIPEIGFIDLLQKTAGLSREKGKFFVYGAFKKKWVELNVAGGAFLRARRLERKFVVRRSRFASATVSQWEGGVRKVADYRILGDYLEALDYSVGAFFANGFGRVLEPYRKVLNVQGFSSDCVLESTASIGCSGKKWRLPVKLLLTVELARLLGYYLAEGSKSKAGCFLDFGSHESDLVSDAAECIEKVFGHKPCIKQKKSVFHISFGGRFFSRLIAHIFSVGNNARTKRIPAMAFNFSADKKMEFLKGYFEGDGNFSTSGQLMCCTASEKLASDIVYLLSTLGIIATIEQGVNSSDLPEEKNSKARAYYKVKISGKGNLQALQRAIPERHRVRFHDYCGNSVTRCGFDGIPIKETGLSGIWLGLPRHYAQRISCRKLKNLLGNTSKKLSQSVVQRLQYLADSDLLFLRIKKIEPCKPSTDFVFDVSVQDNENFVGGLGGIFLHNTLALIVDREKERKAFKSQKYWVVSALFEKDKMQFIAEHKKGKFWEKEQAEKILQKKSEYGVVSQVQIKQRVLEKPFPFDTTAFLRASTALGLTAGEAMNIAETLYQNGFISYPRTDNQAYPPNLDLKQILVELQKVPVFKPLSEKILAKPLNPSKGKETKDHPPIHPVSAANPSALTEKQWRVYELVCRRFFATLAEEAVTLNTSVELLLQNEPFIANGQTILKMGWKEFYPYSTLKEVILPKLEKGDKAKLLDLKMEEKETQPLPRYSQSALIKLMSELGLGTKCFTGNTAFKVFNSPTPKLVSMQEVFEKSRSTGLMDESAEIRKNEKLDCIGVSPGGCIQRSRFLLASKRPADSAIDRMKKIVFVDGSTIESTAEHPFLVQIGSDFEFKPLKSLKSGGQVIALHDNSCLMEHGRLEWADFVPHCDKKTYLFAHGLAGEIKNARLNAKKSQSAFAKALDCSQGNYSAYESGKRPVPLWLVNQLGLVPARISSQNEENVIQNPFPISVNAPLARILAKLIGDGSLDREKVKKENCFDFRYTNLNRDLIEEFASDIETVFNTRSSIYVQDEKFAVKVPAVAGRMISVLFPDVLKKLPWAGLPPALYPDFVGAFLDDEGHVNKSETKLFLSNTNHQTLRVLQKMLKELSIQSGLETKAHKLHVRQRQSLFDFLERIPIASVKKKQRLVEILSTRYRYAAKNRPLFVFEKQILTELKEPITSLELSNRVKVPKQTVINRIRKLKKEGKIKKLVDGNNKDLPRINRYVSQVKIPDSAYSLLGEKVCAPKLVTKTIHSIEDVLLPEFVYDITNSIEYPAFVLANNVVAHNSTRHEIIQKLYARRYISGLKAIEPNQIAFAVIDSLQKHCKKVTEPKMTADLEAEMDEIAVGKTTKAVVVTDSRKVLLDVLEELLREKNAIATELRQGLRQDSIMGKCTDPSCGGDLLIRFGKTGKRFLGCSKYPPCTVTYPLPQKGKVAHLGTLCEVCQAPKIRLYLTRSSFEMCVNMNCSTKDEWKKRSAELKQKAEQKSAAIAAKKVLEIQKKEAVVPEAEAPAAKKKRTAIEKKAIVSEPKTLAKKRSAPKKKAIRFQ